MCTKNCRVHCTLRKADHLSFLLHRHSESPAHYHVMLAAQGAVTTITAGKPTEDMTACFAIFYGKPHPPPCA